MARPSDWSPVDMDRDPTPGNPDEVRELADDLQTFADDVGEALGRIRGMAEDRAVLDWAGLSAEAFRSEFDGVPPNLQKLQTSYDMAAQALQTYWPKLETAQGMADRALDRAIAAQADLSTAQAALTDAQDWVSRAGDEAERLEREGERENVEPPSEAEVRAATRDATAANEAASSAQSRVDAAEEALSAARQLALDAKEMREEAARTCASEIDAASDAGIQNRRWWEDAIHWVSENWDTIVEICKVVVAVLGIVVMIIGGPLAWVVLAAALVVLADTLYDYANGRASLWDVAFAALDCIPGMKGLTTLGGLAVGVRALARGGLRGMAAGVRGLATRGRTMIADGMQSAYSRARTMIRSGGTDPVDLATGHMYLPQTDVTLPGTLPFAFTRRVQSGYYAGRWFGPSWSSTLDQRLEVDEEGVVFLAEDGLVLAYPHPKAPSTAVLPESGPRWPLARQEDGGYALTDPVTGHIRHFRRPDGDGDCRILGISDRNGNRVDIDYDPHGAPTAIRHSGGYHLTLTTEHGRVTTLALGDTLIRRYAYTDGNLTAVLNPAGQPLQFTYDHRLRVTSWTDTNNRRYAYTYDDHDRCVAEGGEAGHLALTLAYDGTHPDWPDARVTTLTTAQGTTSHYIIDDHHDVIAEIDPLGNVTRTEYDADHHTVAETDPLGHATRVSRNADGQPLIVRFPDGTFTRYEYNDLALPVSIALPDGTTWLREYDERGNCVSVTDPLGATTRYTHDAFGGIASVTDPLGATTRIRCDGAGLPTELTDPLGNTATRRYDSFGRPDRITDSSGAETRVWWSADGHLTRLVDASGAEQTWQYDGEGNCVRHTNAAGAVVEYEYTHFDALTARTEADGVRYEFEHDAALRLVRVTNPQGLAWEYDYDAAGRLIAETDFDGRRVGYAWDAAGRLAELTNPLGQTIAYEHDSMGRLIAKHFGDHSLTYGYDPLGRLLHASGPDCEVRWERDLAGRVLAETINGRTLSLELDAAGRRVSRTTPGAGRTSYDHDAAGRRVALDVSGHVLSSTHDAVGRETTRVLGDSFTLNNVWDPVGRLTHQELAGGRDQPLLTRAWTYRADGYVTALQDSVRGDSAFALDASGRVTGVDARGWTESYAYDVAGNQSHATWSSHHPAQEATGARTLEGTRLVAAGGVRYEYDDAGRVTVKRRTRLSRKPDSWRYSWDAEDRLTSVTTPDGAVWRYRYDPLGRRIAKQRLGEDGTTVVEETSFVWDGVTLAEQTTVSSDAPNPVTLTWEHDGLAPVSQAERITDATTQETIDSRFFAIVTDLVGSPTELVGEDGDVAWHVRRTLWGLSVWRADARAYTPLRFPGQYHDPESGLHYNHHRYYDPETARYTSPDPLGLRPTPNPVAYVHNPLNWDDPLGLSPYPAGDAIDDMIGRIDPDSLTMTRTVRNHLDDMADRPVPRPDGGRYVSRSRPFMDSTILIREIMQGSRPALDPRGASGALRWDTPGAFNGSPGTWELVIDTNSNTILHFNFVGTR
ncbi:RHS repeat-associated core domain-containing protein [Streptomyces millisiae]|uniref:RHS repeat-associated core domain-containing protein n=1 Tax=Streptomyces millisiae TaxID=3075542 RepID=A0ABU2LM18_9ACTN|nr:RHS repeat-associated core domain-containing protein [Streptomyces sp. DSM 44918]MDT0318623.1 RHS repeat-associated core domain-containing protein [Streptomyces sp. DSM 44918]